MNASKSAVGVNSLCNALQAMGDRLTHLYLAHNRLAGIPNIVSVLSVRDVIFFLPCSRTVLICLSKVHSLELFLRKYN